MKAKTYIKGLCALGATLSLTLIASCAKDVNVGMADVDHYGTRAGKVMGYVSDDNGGHLFPRVEFRGEALRTLNLHATEASKDQSVVSVEYDLSLLEAYNNEQGTNYVPFPKESFALEGAQSFSLAAGSDAASVQVKLTSPGSQTRDKVSYVLPLRLRVTSGSLVLPESEQTKLIFISDLSGLPEATKYLNGVPATKIFSCMEVNDTNPLNNLRYTLRTSGKPLMDAVILFSGNINYDAESGRVYVFNNENVQALLDNREKYLKPLQDRGIKVILGLLGNHDRAGLAGLGQEVAQLFAKEIKNMCDAYQLDGVMMDDEYSRYEDEDNLTPGLVLRSREAFARLCYEVKKAQPERWVVMYGYGMGSSLPPVDEVQPGEFIDYVVHDYGVRSSSESLYPGLPRARRGINSQELNLGYFAIERSLRKQKEDGYLTHMVFALNPGKNNYSRQKGALELLARVFFEDELDDSGVFYSKDWR